MSPDECRPVEITVADQPETIRVHGGEPMSQEGAQAMGVLVAGVRDRLATEPVSVRRAALAVMREHWPERHRCACGRWALTATQWSVHVVIALAAAGVLLPLEQPVESQP